MLHSVVTIALGIIHVFPHICVILKAERFYTGIERDGSFYTLNYIKFSIHIVNTADRKTALINRNRKGLIQQPWILHFGKNCEKVVFVADPPTPPLVSRPCSVFASIQPAFP